MNPRRRQRLRTQAKAGARFPTRLSLAKSQYLLDERAVDNETLAKGRARQQKGSRH